MTSGVKTALIVAGTAAGAFLLFKAFAPSPSTVKQQASGIANLNSIANLGSSLFAFGSKLFGGTESNDGTYHANASDYTIAGNQLIDPSTGNAVVYGAGY